MNLLKFEEIVMGVTHTAGPYMLDGDEIMEFSAKWDPWEYHTDQDEAGSSLFEGLAASGVHTLCIANLLLHQCVQWDIRALLGAEYRLPNPTRMGDQMMISRCVSEKRGSKSRPEFGIVHSEEQLTNQVGTVLLDMKTAVLVAKNGG